MIAKCANPSCSAPFHYLREGRLFRIELPPAHTSQPAVIGVPKPSRRVEHFWLCGDCSSTLTLVVKGDQVQTAPMRVPTFKAAAS
jgi:hypothetical protein